MHSLPIRIAKCLLLDLFEDNFPCSALKRIIEIVSVSLLPSHIAVRFSTSVRSGLTAGHAAKKCSM